MDAGYSEYDSATKQVRVNEQLYCEGGATSNRQASAMARLAPRPEGPRAAHAELQHYPMGAQSPAQSLDMRDAIGNIVGNSGNRCRGADGKPAQP